MFLSSLRWQTVLPHLYPHLTPQKSKRKVHCTDLFTSHSPLILAPRRGLLFGVLEVLGGWHEVWVLQSVSLLRRQSRHSTQNTSEGGAGLPAVLSSYNCEGPERTLLWGRQEAHAFRGARIIKCWLRGRCEHSTAGGNGETVRLCEPEGANPPFPLPCMWP